MQFRSIRRALSNQRGSSLLECLLSLTLFSFAMIMLATMLSTAGVITNRATDLETSVNNAVNLAEKGVSTITHAVTLEFVSAVDSTRVSISTNLVEINDGESHAVGEDSVKLWRFETKPPAGT